MAVLQQIIGLDLSVGRRFISLPPCFRISYVSPACIRRIIHYQDTPPPSSFVSNTDVRPFTAHAPLDHVGETVALNLSSSSPTSQKTTNPQHSPPSPHAGIPLATVVWWCLPSNQTLSFLYGHIALALQSRQVKIAAPCRSRARPTFPFQTAAAAPHSPALSFAVMSFSIKWDQIFRLFIKYPPSPPSIVVLHVQHVALREAQWRSGAL